MNHVPNGVKAIRTGDEFVGYTYRVGNGRELILACHDIQEKRRAGTFKYYGRAPRQCRVIEADEIVNAYSRLPVKKTAVFVNADTAATMSRILGVTL